MISRAIRQESVIARSRAVLEITIVPNAIRLESIAGRIHFLPGERVILDVDLAMLYNVETRTLNQTVRRNLQRFPGDFMFELSLEEFRGLMSQTVISKRGGRRKLPLAFTEQGVAMLSGILNSQRAIETNIAIMRTFVALRKWMQSNAELAAKIKQLESKYDEQFKVVFDAIRQLIKEEREERPIGFQRGKE